eukprot:scaffold75656_cov48-Phaeocystis_antarctica.AAC.1
MMLPRLEPPSRWRIILVELAAAPEKGRGRPALRLFAPPSVIGGDATIVRPFNPLPAPGNGGHPETPLSRLTPNVGEDHPIVCRGFHPKMHGQLLVG